MKSILSLPVDERYRFIYALFTQQFNGDARKTSEFCGCSLNTVKNAISRIEHPSPFGKKGPEPIIKPHHLIFIEVQTQLDHYLTNEQLAELLVQNFEDITHC